MGYHTHYSLGIELAPGALPGIRSVEIDAVEVIEHLRRECDEAAYALADDGGVREAAQWYEHQADLRAFSKKYPHLLFTLHGQGEDNSDIWALYVVNGKAHKATAQILIPPFDPGKLA